MNELVKNIRREAARLDIRRSLAEASKRLRLLLLESHQREPQVSKGFIIAARCVVILAGVNFAVVGALLISAACVSFSWGSLVVGGAILSASLLLLWTGIARNRNPVCNLAVVSLAELFSKLRG